VLLNTARLGQLRLAGHADLVAYNKPVKLLGRGLRDALDLSFEQLFPEDQDLADCTTAEVQLRGAFLLQVSTALQILQGAREGSRGAGVHGVQEQFGVAGFAASDIASLLQKVRSKHGVSARAVIKRRRQP
jgi:hypothetical protein